MPGCYGTTRLTKHSSPAQRSAPSAGKSTKVGSAESVYFTTDGYKAVVFAPQPGGQRAARRTPSQLAPFETNAAAKQPRSTQREQYPDPGSMQYLFDPTKFPFNPAHPDGAAGLEKKQAGDPRKSSIRFDEMKGSKTVSAKTAYSSISSMSGATTDHVREWVETGAMSNPSIYATLSTEAHRKTFK